MSEKFRLDRKIGFQNTFYTKCINVIIESIGPSIILRSISFWYLLVLYVNCSVKRLKFAPKWLIFYFQPILAAIIVTIAMVKVKLVSDLYTWSQCCA